MFLARLRLICECECEFQNLLLLCVNMSVYDRLSADHSSKEPLLLPLKFIASYNTRFLSNLNFHRPRIKGIVTELPFLHLLGLKFGKKFPLN